VALHTWSSNVDRVLTAPVQWSATTIGGALDRAPVAVGAAVGAALTAVWPLSTLLVLAAFGVSYRRHRAELSHAERHDIAGVSVSVTEALGPAVIGVRAPRIVVPAWLLERSAHEQRLVITHEQSHIAAHDPLLLLSACIAVALMPWNPIAWFALARLRLAIELDCDRRVLGTGASTRQYGQLLIELSSHVPQFMHGGIARTPLALTSPAFSYHASHLERRLITMTSRPSQFLRSRRIGSGLLAAVALLAACAGGARSRSAPRRLGPGSEGRDRHRRGRRRRRSGRLRARIRCRRCAGRHRRGGVGGRRGAGLNAVHQDLVARAVRDDPAAFDHDDPVGGVDHRHAVRRDHDRATAAPGAQPGDDAGLGRLVQAHGGLVEQQHRAAADERSRECHHLSLTP
jgi:beta-lactamase regulating signal transducer with metallopeptidase domain